MPSWLELSVRIVAGLFAFSVFYLAWFVYEDREKRMQSKLEDWWLEIEEAGASAKSRRAAFFESASRRIGDGLTKIFGSRLLSLRGLAVAVCVWLALLALAHRRGVGVMEGRLYVLVSVTSLVMVAIGSSRPRLRSVPTCFVAVIAVIAAASESSREAFGLSMFEGELAYWLLAVAGIGAGTVLSFAALARWLLAKLQRRSGESRAWIALAQAGSLSVLLVTGSMLANVFALASLLEDAADLPAFVLFVLGYGFLLEPSLWIATALPTAILALAGALGSHRLFWPILARAIYPLQRHRIVERKGLLNTVALALVGLAVLPWENLTEELADWLI